MKLICWVQISLIPILHTFPAYRYRQAPYRRYYKQSKQSEDCKRNHIVEEHPSQECTANRRCQEEYFYSIHNLGPLSVLEAFDFPELNYTFEFGLSPWHKTNSPCPFIVHPLHHFGMCHNGTHEHLSIFLQCPFINI